MADSIVLSICDLLQFELMLIFKWDIDTNVWNFQGVSTSFSSIVPAFGFGPFGELTAWAKPDCLGRNCNADQTMVKFDLVETR